MMDDWTPEQIRWNLDRTPIAARTRISTSKGLCRVDLYHRDGEYPRKLISALEDIGWTFGGSHDALPKNVCGYFYEHSKISQETAEATRSIVDSMLLPAPPVPAAPAVPNWKRERDDDGWVIPRANTRYRKIYDLAKAGVLPNAIGRAVRLPPSHVKVALKQIGAPVTLEAPPPPGRPPKKREPVTPKTVLAITAAPKPTAVVVVAAPAPPAFLEYRDMLVFPEPPRLALPAPRQLREWSTPVVEETEAVAGWAVIQWVEDLPKGQIAVAGEDHEPMIAEIVDDEEWFPWKANGKLYRWDQFDWWQPVSPER